MRPEYFFDNVMNHDRTNDAEILPFQPMIFPQPMLLLVVLAGIPNHSFLSPQALQGDILDNDDNKEDDDDDNHDNNDDDGHLEWSIMLLFMMEEKTLLLLSIKPDYQLVRAVQMSLQV